jgi:membrane protein
LLVAAAIAIWSGSNGINAFIKAMNRAYGVDEARPFVRKRLVSIGLTLLLVGMLNASFILLVYGQRIAGWAADRIGAGSVFESVWGVSQWPVAIVGLVLVLCILFAVGPNRELTFWSVVPGAVIGTGLWLVLVFGFSLYLRFSEPGSAYGALSSVIVLLFFLYLTAMVFLIGAEINAIIREERYGDVEDEPKAA